MSEQFSIGTKNLKQTNKQINKHNNNSDMTHRWGSNSCYREDEDKEGSGGHVGQNANNAATERANLHKAAGIRAPQTNSVLLAKQSAEIFTHIY